MIIEKMNIFIDTGMFGHSGPTVGSFGLWEMGFSALAAHRDLTTRKFGPERTGGREFP